MLQVTPSIAIPENELDERFVRASGPGGQNVNKVSTAVELRFDVGASSLTDDVKARLRALAGKRMSQDDVLLIDSRELVADYNTLVGGHSRASTVYRLRLSPDASHVQWLELDADGADAVDSPTSPRLQ